MIVSNTQVSLENLCERAHYYRFILGIEPKTLPPALYRGVLGHAALEAYYLEMKEGASLDTCLKAAKSVLDKEIARIATETPEEFEQIMLVQTIYPLIVGYARRWEVEPFKILEIEHEYQVPITDHIQYAMKLDMLVEMTRGKYRGDLIVVDHKFVYNFKTQLDIDMDAQLPKYVWTMRQNGYIVTKGMFNQIRTRELKAPTPDDLYRREFVDFTSRRKEMEQIWREQKLTAERLVDKIGTGSKKAASQSPRTLSLLVCRSCTFKDPCKAELNGNDITHMLQSNYQKSTYGYTDLNAE